MEVLKAYALSFLGLPYRWGGDCPTGGFDCSGLVCEILKSEGILANSSDYSSQTLHDTFRNTWPSLQSPQFGAIAFYGRSLKEISHVTFCLDHYRMIEAGGGNSKTVSREMAEQQAAFVRIRPVYFRKDFLVVLMPRYAFS